MADLGMRKHSDAVGGSAIAGRVDPGASAKNFEITRLLPDGIGDSF